VGYSLGAYLGAYLLFNIASVKSLATIGGCGMAMALIETKNPQLENKRIISFSNKSDGAEDEDRDFTQMLAEHGREYDIVKRPGFHQFADYAANGSVQDAFRHSIEEFIPPGQQGKAGESFINLFRSGFREPHAWVMFENGTSVVIVNPTESIAQQAINVLSETYASEKHLDLEDVGVNIISGDSGWLVTSRNPDICNLVLFNDVGADNADDTFGIASFAKRLRRKDWIDRRVIHVEAATATV
jgi:hypothetical protein